MAARIEIRVEVPEEMAQRVDRPPIEIVRILELGFQQYEAAKKPPRARVIEALRGTGLITQLGSDILQRYGADETRRRQPPLQAEGKPVSQLIIQERDRC